MSDDNSVEKKSEKSSFNKKVESITVYSPMEAICVLLELRRRNFVSYRGQRNSNWALGPHGIWKDKEAENIEQIKRDLLKDDELKSKLFNQMIKDHKFTDVELALEPDEDVNKPSEKMFDKLVRMIVLNNEHKDNDKKIEEDINAYWYSKYKRRKINDKLNQFIKYSQKKDEIKDGDKWWSKMFFAQHYGLRTLLLDWTSNPLVALYFAVENILSGIEDKNEKTGEVISGSVFALKVSDVNDEDNSIQARWHEFNDVTEKYANGENCPFWIMINPPFNNDRLRRQSGKFSYHPSYNDRNLVDENSKAEIFDGELLVRIDIAKSEDGILSKDIRQALGVMNIHHGSLFPDYTGYSQFVNKEWEHITRKYPENDMMYELGIRKTNKSNVSNKKNENSFISKSVIKKVRAILSDNDC